MWVVVVVVVWCVVVWAHAGSDTLNRGAAASGGPRVAWMPRNQNRALTLQHAGWLAGCLALVLRVAGRVELACGKWGGSVALHVGGVERLLPPR